MAPLRGWAPAGERLHAQVPYGHWRTMTFVAALRCDRIDAPCVLNQPVNGPSFTAWAEQFLVPTPAPGVEQMFAELKHLLRTAAKRSHEATWRRIGNLLDAFSPHECANSLTNSGDASA